MEPRSSSSNDKIVKMFHKCDANKSGFIEREDLATSFPDLSPQDIDEIYGHVDTNRDGVISLDEFASAYAERQELLSTKGETGSKGSVPGAETEPDTNSVKSLPAPVPPNGEQSKSVFNGGLAERGPVPNLDYRVRSVSDAAYAIGKKRAPRAPPTITSPGRNERSHTLSASYKKSRFRNMKIPAKNKTIVGGVVPAANDDDNANVVVEEEGNESGDDTITEMDEEFIHAQKTAKRRPSLQQASPDQTNLDELRVIEDQKRIFTETLSEIPCESEIYRLYELISSPVFEETAAAPPGQRQSLSSNPRRKSGDVPSPSPTATEAKHLFEEIFYTLLTDYRNKKSDLEKYSSLYKEKAKECKDLAEKLNSVSLHGFENPNSETGELEGQESSCDLQLIRNRFPSSTGLSPTTIRVSRPSNSTLSPYTIELPSDVRGSKSSIGDINTTPSYEKFRANSVSRRDSFTQTLPSLLVVNKASPVRKKEDSVESVDYLNTKVSDRIFNVILAGDTSVGKTSLLIQFCQNYFDPETHSTLGIDCHTKTVIYEGLKVTLKIWDTVGQERFRSLTKSYFRRADGIMLVYDSTQEDSLMNIRYWMDTIKETASKHDISIVICANKCDLIPREPSAHTLNSLALDIANENDAAFWRMSAKTGKNVENGFTSLIKMMIDREDNELFKTTAISLKSARPTPSKKCCE